MRETTAALINERNAEFWAVQSVRTAELIADPFVFKLAFDDLRADEVRHELRLRKTLEDALERAGLAKALVIETVTARDRADSRLQAERARMRRAPAAVHNAILTLARDPARNCSCAKDLWKVLIERLRELNLEPVEEMNARGALMMRYTDKQAVRQMSFKRFANIVSENRQPERSRGPR